MSRILITTSRKASLRTKQFAKDLALSLPAAEYFARGKAPIDKIADDARYLGAKNVLVVCDLNSNPAELLCMSISEISWNYEFRVRIALQKLRKELGGSPKQKFTALKLQLSSAKIKGFFKWLEVQSESDSENLLKEQNSSLSFYSNKIELGPKFKVLQIQYEKH